MQSEFNLYQFFRPLQSKNDPFVRAGGGCVKTSVAFSNQSHWDCICALSVATSIASPSQFQFPKLHFHQHLQTLFGFMENKFGFIVKSPETFEVPNSHFSHKLGPILAPGCVLCVAQFQIKLTLLIPPPSLLQRPVTPKVFVCFLRKLSSRVKRAFHKRPPPSTSVESRQSFRFETQIVWNSNSLKLSAAMYQWSQCLYDKRVIPQHMKPRQ